MLSLAALVLCFAPAPLPRPAPKLPALNMVNLVGTWEVRYNRLDSVMTFGPDFHYRETLRSSEGTLYFAGLWSWDNGQIVIVCKLAGDDGTTYAHRLRLDENWSGRCLNYGVKVRFVRKRKE